MKFDPARITVEQWAKLQAACRRPEAKEDWDLPFSPPSLEELEALSKKFDPGEVDEDVRSALLALCSDPDEDRAIRVQADSALHQGSELSALPRIVPAGRLAKVPRARTSTAAGGNDELEEIVEGDGLTLRFSIREQDHGSLTMTVRVIASRSAIVRGSKLRLPTTKGAAPIETELSWDGLGKKWVAQFVLSAEQREQLPDNPFPEIVTPEPAP